MTRAGKSPGRNTTVQAPSPHSQEQLTTFDKMHATKDTKLTRRIPQRRQNGMKRTAHRHTSKDHTQNTKYELYQSSRQDGAPHEQIRDLQDSLATTNECKILAGNHADKKKKDRPLQLSRVTTSK